MVLSRIAFEKTDGISLFNFGDHDLVFAKRDKASASVNLTMMSEESLSEFSSSTFEIDENVRIVEILESTEASFEYPFLRLLGIRDSEELLCWEVRHDDSPSMQVVSTVKQLKVYSRADRSDFRWPFFAYALTNNTIVINYLPARDVSFFYQFPFDDIQTSYIHQLCFSKSCDLYVVCHENNDHQMADRRVCIYRLRPGMDISVEMQQGKGRETLT